MKYSIWTISFPYTNRNIFDENLYDKTNDLESAIFVGKLLLSKTVERVHIMEDGQVKAFIKRDGDISSPEVFVKL